MSASKKNFKNNPALQFITSNTPEEPVEPLSSLEPSQELATHEEEETDEELEALIDELHAVIEKILAKRNSKTPPEGYKQNPKFIQKKNRRVQLVLQQGLYDRIKEAANTEHLSVNEYVHSILDIVTPHLDEK